MTGLPVPRGVSTVTWIEACMIGAAATPVVAAAGYLIGLRGRRADAAKIEGLQTEIARCETQLREQQRLATRLRNEQRTIVNFMWHLPTAVRSLNRDSLDPRGVPKMLLDLALTIFEPEQIAVYLMRRSEPGADPHLHLVASRGIDAISANVQEVKVGDGKIGWVAQRQLDMVAEDWLSPGRLEGACPKANDSRLRLDLICPLLHFGGSDPTHPVVETLGVLCLGAPAVRHRDEKLMLQMIANLGTIALVHSRNVRRLREKANHDGLTGLMNKRHVMDELGCVLIEAARKSQSVGVFLFDIDHFKHYNDGNGHRAGDELLRVISRVVRESLRPGDLAGRYGGEEFLVAMPDTDGTTALRVAERIRSAIEQFRFPHGDAQPGGVLTISGGVAMYPADGSTGTEIVECSDRALYRAKALGRNRVLAYQGVEIGIPDDDCPEPAWDDWSGAASGDPR